MLNYRKHNLWKGFVDFLFDNDEKVATEFKAGIHLNAVLTSLITAFLPIYLGHVLSNAKSLCILP